MAHGTHGRRVSVPSGLPRELRDSSHGGESRRSPEAAGDAYSAYTTKSSQKEGRMMRSLKVLAVVGLAVALVAVPALTQGGAPVAVNAFINCPNGVSYTGILGTLEDNNGTLWGIVTDDPQVTGNWVICTGLAGRKQLVTKKTGPAARPTRVDKFGISYSCARGAFPNNQAGAAQIMATGMKSAGALAAVPGRIRLPCSPEEAEIEITVGPVPTLTEWGLIALAVLLAGSLAFMIRRRLAPRPAGA
jgi:hypothetical protein